MSREAIENTIRAMRDRTAVAYLRRGILGNVSVNAGRRAEDICEMFAGRVEADVADILAENERLKEALKPVLDCITDGIILTSDESSCAEGFDECMNAVNAVDEAKRIYNGGAK